MNAYRSLLAVKMDRGEISIEQGVLTVAEKGAQPDAAANERRIQAENAASVERANNAAAAAAILGVMNANQPLNVNVYPTTDSRCHRTDRPAPHPRHLQMTPRRLSASKPGQPAEFTHASTLPPE